MSMLLLQALGQLLGQHAPQQPQHGQPQQAGQLPHMQHQPLQPQHYTQQQANSVTQNQPLNQPHFVSLPQGGQFNPGYTPLQHSNNALPQPNLLAPHVPQGINFNPQNPYQLY